jgi:hypothetical protein
MKESYSFTGTEYDIVHNSQNLVEDVESGDIGIGVFVSYLNEGKHVCKGDRVNDRTCFYQITLIGLTAGHFCPFCYNHFSKNSLLLIIESKVLFVD